MASQTALNKGGKDYDPLFALGYGLSLGSRKPIGQLGEDPGVSADMLRAASNGVFFSEGRAVAPWRVYLGDSAEARLKTEGDRYVTSRTGAISFESADRNRQEDTKIARWSGKGAGKMFVLGYNDVDMPRMLATAGRFAIPLASLGLGPARGRKLSC